MMSASLSRRAAKVACELRKVLKSKYYAFLERLEKAGDWSILSGDDQGVIIQAEKDLAAEIEAYKKTIA